MLKPLQLSLDTKSDRLKSRALAICQNLIANAALPAEASEAVTAMLARVDKNTDENVQLKTLQTALTLLQSPLRPRSEEQIGAVLGVCLRLTNRKGHKDAVLTTAAATVRQAVALVLSYVDVEAELQGQAAAAEAGESGEAPGGAAFAAQKLVEDLCNIASGGLPAASRAVLLAFELHLRPAGGWRAFSCACWAACGLSCACTVPQLTLPWHWGQLPPAGAPPLWLKSPSLPRTFVLELLDFVLANSPDVFRRLPPFQNALAVRMTQLIQAQLQVLCSHCGLFSFGLGVLGVCYAKLCSLQAFLQPFKSTSDAIANRIRCRTTWTRAPRAPLLPPTTSPPSARCCAWPAPCCAPTTRCWARAAALWSSRCWQVRSVRDVAWVHLCASFLTVAELGVASCYADEVLMRCSQPPVHTCCRPGAAVSAIPACGTHAAGAQPAERPSADIPPLRIVRPGCGPQAGCGAGRQCSLWATHVVLAELSACRGRWPGVPALGTTSVDSSPARCAAADPPTMPP